MENWVSAWNLSTYILFRKEARFYLELEATVANKWSLSAFEQSLHVGVWDVWGYYGGLLCDGVVTF